MGKSIKKSTLVVINIIADLILTNYNIMNPISQ